MTFTNIFLCLQGIGFVLFGLFMFFNPSVSAEFLGAASLSSDGIYELRGIYGGVSVGLGLLVLSGGLKTNMKRPALFALLAYTGGYVLARLAALPLDGMPGGNLPIFIAFEVISALVCILLLRKA